MTESPRRGRHEIRRTGFVAAVLGIAAVGGAGTVAAVAPALPTAHARPAVVADPGPLGVLPSTADRTTTTRDRTDAATPGAAPFPRTSSSPITAIFS
jgi:hypothetical protein